MNNHSFQISDIVEWAGRTWVVVDTTHHGEFQVKVQIANFRHNSPVWVSHDGMRLANDDCVDQYLHGLDCARRVNK